LQIAATNAARAASPEPIAMRSSAAALTLQSFAFNAAFPRAGFLSIKSTPFELVSPFKLLQRSYKVSSR
jgi:hypothetical protein